VSEWLLAAAIGALAAAVSYVRLAAPGPVARAGLALLRVAALTLLLALLFDAPLGRSRPPAPWAFLDASASMTRGGARLDLVARDSLRAEAESTFLFGDSVRPLPRTYDATDRVTHVRPVVERTMAAGRPALIVTDGEIRDSAAISGLAAGSRVVVIPRPAERDAAVVSLDAPHAAVAGDSMMVRVTLAAAGAGAGRGEVILTMNDATLGRWPIDSMSAWGERQLELRARVAGQAGGASILRAIVTSAGDMERRNDTLAASVDISRAATAVFISSSPDQDSRFALAILRGALALPTRGYLRVAPGAWRVEGTLSPVAEADVRAALKDALVAIIHGDTAVFGPPQSATLGPLALIVPADDEGEWYAVGTPPSPLTPSLAALPLDSLPPVAVGAPPMGDWVALEARRGREPTRRAVVAGRDAPRRVVTVSGTGFWRWSFRGGASADAHAALWGGIFDWLAAERVDRRGAVPDVNVLRSGEPVRWRRGSAMDSLVQVVLTRRGGSADTLALRFPPGVAIAESAPLTEGVHEVTVRGGRSLLVVNASAELLPNRPRLRNGAVAGRARPDGARGARSTGWLYVAVVLLLCLEWIGRRRAGLR